MMVRMAAWDSSSKLVSSTILSSSSFLFFEDLEPDGRYFSCGRKSSRYLC